MANLLDLPAEMKVRILSSLLPKEIQRLRAVSRCFHQTIDINEYQLATPYQTRALSHIKDDLNSLFPAVDLEENDRKRDRTDDSTNVEHKVGFLELLDLMLTRRGLWLHREMILRILRDVINIWTFQNFGISMTRQERTPDEQGLQNRLAAVAHELIHLHLQSQLNTTFRDYEEDVFGEAIYRMCADEIMELTTGTKLVLKSDLLWGWRTTVIDQRQAYFKACGREPTHTAQPLQLTNLRYYHIVENPWVTGMGPELGEEHDYKVEDVDLAGVGQEGELRMLQVFGLPQIPAFTNRILAYCARSRWAQRQILEVAGGTNIKPLLKAALLGEIYLY